MRVVAIGVRVAILLCCSTETLSFSTSICRPGVKSWSILRSRGENEPCGDESSSWKSIDRRSFFLSAACLLVLSAFTPVEANAAQILTETSSVSKGYSQSINTYDPDIPFSSARAYKKIKLTNGLSVLLVSDRSALRCSAALTVAGTGQFSDPKDLPGLAHLLEHMILSYNSKSIFKQPRDFEDWLGDNEGASNAFTAYQKTCFHFSCPESVFSEALQRFSALFVQQDVEKICRDAETLQREIRRVDAELNFDDVSSQAFYLTKSFVNLEHPFSKFSAGSLETLETKPKQQGIDVSNRLIEFFRKLYLPNGAILVLVGRQDFFALERMAAPFSTTLSRAKPSSDRSPAARELPGAFLQGNRYKHVVLHRKNNDENTEDISFQWTTNFDYRDTGKVSIITATNVAFVLAQILARKGPGSLFQFLQRRGWVPNDPSGIFRVSVPVEVSRFQIIKATVKLTQEGFINRSSVVSAVYDSFDCLRRGGSYVISRDLLRQYATIAKLHAFSLTPRAPDAVELAMDAQLYGFRSPVGTGRWYRFPEDRGEISALQRAVSDTFAFMVDPSNALIIATAGSGTLAKTEERNSGSSNIAAPPSLSSPAWLTEPITGGRFFFDDMLKQPYTIEQLVLKRIVNRDELFGPVINPLVPSFLRPPRIVQEVTAGRVNVNELLLFRTASEESNEDRVLRMSSSNKRSQETMGPGWQILEPSYPGQTGLPIPRGPPESSCRCVFAFELISSRPVRANVRQAAQAELWKISFEATAKDLVEYGGAPGGLSYEISFNNFGMRVAILGISQTLPSFTRRLARRLVEHSYELLQGPQYFPPTVTSAAIYRAERSRWSSQRRKRAFISNLRRSTAYEAAGEGIAFFRSCYGAVCFAQGDLLRRELSELMQELQTIFEPAFGKNDRVETSSALPDIEDLLYKPVWKPSFSCAIPGMNLLSDGCGRIPR